MAEQGFCKPQVVGSSPIAGSKFYYKGFMIEGSKNTVKITVAGYGGEFVLGTVTPEQHEYWMTLGEDALSEYVWDADDYAEENRIPEEMHFVNQGGWYEVSDVQHLWGCDADSSWVEIEMPNGDSIQHDSIFDLRNKYEEEEESSDIGEDYCVEDQMVREIDECYTGGGDNYSLEPGSYFTAYSSEKGTFIEADIDLDENEEFDERRLVFHTYDLDGSEFLTEVSYIYKGDDVDDPTALDSVGGDTTGKGFECSLFEVTRPNKEEE